MSPACTGEPLTCPRLQGGANGLANSPGGQTTGGAAGEPKDRGQGAEADPMRWAWIGGGGLMAVGAVAAVVVVRKREKNSALPMAVAEYQGGAGGSAPEARAVSVSNPKFGQ